MRSRVALRSRWLFSCCAYAGCVMPRRAAISAWVSCRCSRQARAGDAPSTARLITSWGIKPWTLWFWLSDAIIIENTREDGLADGALMACILILLDYWFIRGP